MQLQNRPAMLNRKISERINNRITREKINRNPFKKYSFSKVLLKPYDQKSKKTKSDYSQINFRNIIAQKPLQNIHYNKIIQKQQSNVGSISIRNANNKITIINDINQRVHIGYNWNKIVGGVEQPLNNNTQSITLQPGFQITLPATNKKISSLQIHIQFYNQGQQTQIFERINLGEQCSLKRLLYGSNNESVKTKNKEVVTATGQKGWVMKVLINRL